METFDATSTPTAAEIEAVAKFEAAFAANDPAAMIEISRSMEFSKALTKTACAAAIAMCKKCENDPKRIAYLFLKSFSDEQMRETTKKIQRARFNKLEARIAELENDPPFKYDGPHETGKTYRKGMFVTHGGSVWHANYKTASRPGDGPAWTLAVKHGANGRDLR